MYKFKFIPSLVFKTWKFGDKFLVIENIEHGSSVLPEVSFCLLLCCFQGCCELIILS